MNLSIKPKMREVLKRNELKARGVRTEARCLVFALAAIACLVPASTLAGEEPSGKISGQMIGDYYAIVSNHDPGLEKQNGFWFRRIYLKYDQGLTEGFSIRARLEFSSPGDFKTNAKLEPNLKDGYLKWTRGDHRILFGLSPTPTWSRVEGVYGYRSVEKTSLDLHKLGSSRDFGLSLGGALGSGKKLHYHFMIGNGSGTGSETNKDKKIYLSLAVKPVKGLTVEVYGDWENRPGDTDRSTVQVFTGYEAEAGRFGLQFGRQTRKGGPGVSNLDLEILSLFGAGRFTEKVWGFVRFDRMFDKNPDGNKISYIPFDPTAKSNFIVSGIDMMPIPKVHIIPNVEFIVYDKMNNVRPDADVFLRLTTHFKF